MFEEDGATIKLTPLWSFASHWKDNGSELSMSLTINRRMFTSAKLQDDVQESVTISTVVVVLALAHTHTPTHGAVIWHNRSHRADKDGDGILSSPHGWWQSLLQQMWLNPTKAIPSAGRCHLLWQCLSNYIRFGWAINGMSQAIKDFATPAVSQSTIYTFTNWSSVKTVNRKVFKG